LRVDLHFHLRLVALQEDARRVGHFHGKVLDVDLLDVEDGSGGLLGLLVDHDGVR